MSVSQPEVEGSATGSAGSGVPVTGNAEEEGGYSAGVEMTATAQSIDTDATDSGTALHPLVSSILSSQKFLSHKDGVHRYDRQEMMRISKLPLAVKRHSDLKTDFDGDDGKFSPYKWLEAIWESEGLGTKAMQELKKSKKLQEALNSGAVDENSGLSPQRRGFSSGCRAPQEDKERSSAKEAGKDKDNGDRLGSTKARNWRSGSSGGASASAAGNENIKFSNTKTDFQLPFQKKDGDRTAGGTKSSVWRTAGSETGKAGQDTKNIGKKYAKDDRSMMMNEKLPEWADGTTTMDDMIELKGFEEPVKKTRRGQRKKENGRGDSTSRPTSRGNADDETANKKKEETPDSVDENSKSSGVTGIAGASETGPDKSAAIGEELQRASAMGAGLPKATLPENDLELAALLGLLDGDTIKQSAIPDPILPSVEESAPSGSRLSRFFRNSANAAPGANAPTHEVAGSRISPPKSALPPSMSGSVSAAADLVRSTQSPSEDSPVLPVLAKIFGQQHNTTPAEVQPQATQPNLPTRGLRGVMRLEDIERGLVSGQSSSQSIDELKGGKQSRQSSLAAKGNPLQDPSQQAHLINQLYKISRMQEGSGEQQEHHHGAAGQQTQPGLHGLFGVPSSSQEPPSAVSAASATSAPHHPVVQALLANAHSNQQSPNPIFANILQNNPAMAAHIHASAQQMLAQFSLANPGQPIPQGIQDQINLLALRHHIALQQQHQHQQQQQQENLDMHHQHAHPLAAAAAHLQQQQQQQQQADPVTSSATSQGPGGLPPHLAALLSGLHQNAAQAAAPSNPLLHANILQRLAENPSLSEHIQASAQQMLAQMALSGQQQPFQDQINLAAMRNLLSAQQQQQQQQQQQEGSFDQSQANAAGSSSAVPPTPPAHSIPSLLAAAASAGQHPNAAALQALHHGTVLQRLAENPALINAHIQASVHQMMAQAALQNPGQPVPQQIQDQINMLAIRNRALMQQQVAAYVSMQQAAAAAQQQQQNAAKSAAAAGNRPTMIPASVQRVMRANGGATTTGAAGSASGTGQGSAE